MGVKDHGLYRVSKLVIYHFPYHFQFTSPRITIWLLTYEPFTTLITRLYFYHVRVPPCRSPLVTILYYRLFLPQPVSTDDTVPPESRTRDLIPISLRSTLNFVVSRRLRGLCSLDRPSVGESTTMPNPSHSVFLLSVGPSFFTDNPSQDSIIFSKPFSLLQNTYYYTLGSPFFVVLLP